MSGPLVAICGDPLMKFTPLMSNLHSYVSVEFHNEAVKIYI